MILNQLCGSTSLEAKKHGLGNGGGGEGRDYSLTPQCNLEEDLGKAEDHCSV